MEANNFYSNISTCYFITDDGYLGLEMEVKRASEENDEISLALAREKH